MHLIFSELRKKFFSILLYNCNVSQCTILADFSKKLFKTFFQLIILKFLVIKIKFFLFFVLKSSIWNFQNSYELANMYFKSERFLFWIFLKSYHRYWKIKKKCWNIVSILLQPTGQRNIKKTTRWFMVSFLLKE